MCLIIASPSGKTISEEVLRDAARTNSHGCGLSWLDLDKKKIQFRKALTVDELIKVLNEEATGKPWVAHFRIASIGPAIPELTHPFTIDEEASIQPSGEADAVLFQNGTFSTWKEYLLQAVASSGLEVPEGPWSDTRAVAFLCHVYGKHVLSLLDNTSRFLIFDATGTAKKRMLLWGSWEDHDGFKFSNRGNCAFHTHTRTSHGGGSTNPTNAAERNAAADAPDEDEAADAIAEAAARIQHQQTSGLTSSTSRNPGSHTSIYKPSKRHNIWKNFSDEGVFVLAADEPSPTGA